MHDSSRSALASSAPALFVFLWSTGFIGAKYGLPYIEPLTFLTWRFGFVIAIIGTVALAWRAPWPKTPRELFDVALVGLLVQAGYLSGVFVAIGVGLPSGVAALVVGLQPLLTAFGAGLFLGERITPRQWLGFALGFGGVVLVVWHRLVGGWDALGGLPFSIAAVVAISAGTLYQKRHCAHVDQRSGMVVQYVAALALVWPAAALVETMEVRWSGELIFAMSWLVIVLSLGAIALLTRLIRAGSAAKVGSFFYLVPPTTSLIAWLVFGETLTLVQLVGMAVTVTGVALATRG